MFCGTYWSFFTTVEHNIVERSDFCLTNPHQVLSIGNTIHFYIPGELYEKKKEREGGREEVKRYGWMDGWYHQLYNLSIIHGMMDGWYHQFFVL